MSVTINSESGQMSAFARKQHPECFVCSPENSRGMQVDFNYLLDGSVEAKVFCIPEFQGYAGLMHGGLISSLLDAAMTQCMLARDIPALTAKLEVRYLRPVAICSELKVRAQLVFSRPPLHELKATLFCGDAAVARAKAKFIDKRLKNGLR